MTKLEAAAASNDNPRQLTLWIDGCGGFGLLTGSRCSIGGVSASSDCDVQVQTDWPRRAGWIERLQGEYFWCSEGKEKQWLRHGELVPIPGTAKLRLERPNPLSHSATLTLASPHRFANHLDAWVLVQDTVIIGPGQDCHVRCRELDERWVLVESGEKWRLKVGQSPAKELEFGRRMMSDRVGLTLEIG